MTGEDFKREDFDEDSPRFIPMTYDGSLGFYLFDTVKLDYLDFSHYYMDYNECEKSCDILNGIDYLLKENK